MIEMPPFIAVSRKRAVVRTASAIVVIAMAPLWAIESLQNQKSGDGPLRFEVASVKRNVSETPTGVGGAGGPAIGVRGRRLTAVNTSLNDIIRYAYQLEPFQSIEGAPPWLVDRFDIAAAIPDSASGADAPRLMLQTLLADRFRLSVRWTKRDQSVYALSVARRDGRLGSGLTLSRMDCEAWRATERQQGRGAVSAAVELRSGRPTCDMAFQPFRARLTAGARTMSDLARFLSRLPAVGAPVLDRTGLTGAFDFDLLYAPAKPGAPADSTSVPGGLPSVFVAIEEQLGLKLERTRGPVDHLVIQRIEPLAPE